MPPTLNDDDADADAASDGSFNDTIVVKGEYEAWSPPSSAHDDEISPSLEPLVSHLLASITPRALESPGPISSSSSSPSDDNDNHSQREHHEHDLRTSSSSPHPTKRRHRVNALTMEERLQLMPPKRALPWRPGVEPGADAETGGESRRKQIRFGCLLATRGEEQVVPCRACANGRGKFSICVALDGFFRGACASCQLSGRPNRCSIKASDDAPENSPTNTPVGGASLLHNSTTSEGPKPKRRRTEKQQQQKESVPEWESARPQWEQELGDSQARQNEMVQAPWAPVNPPPLIPPTNPRSHSQVIVNGMGGGGMRSAPTPRHSMDASNNPNSSGWAAVNQQSPPPPSSFQGYKKANGEAYQDKGSKREDATLPDDREPGAALIDTLPKQKQRQVYGLVSGLQGGIEHLQRELDSLKRALGIDEA